MLTAVLIVIAGLLLMLDVFLCAWLWAQITRAEEAERERDEARAMCREHTARMGRELDAAAERYRV